MAARQHGVIDHAQLLSAGVTPSGVDRRVAAGWLHRCHVGVYAVGHPGLTPHGHWMAATLAGRSGAVLSHRSAAALWGIGPDGDLPSITVAELVKTIDNATNARRIGRTTMSSVMHAAPGRRGLKALRQVLLITRPQDALTRSELERRALRLIARSGLDTPEVNVRLHARKIANLMAHGWTVMRFTWRQVVNDPAWVSSRLAAWRRTAPGARR